MPDSTRAEASLPLVSFFSEANFSQTLGSGEKSQIIALQK